MKWGIGTKIIKTMRGRWQSERRWWFSPSLDDYCLVYGIGCPEQDTTNYKDPPNQNPSKCYCEPFDGIGSMSKVTCPDGTVSIYYFSCLEWEYMFSSSSQSSSSAAPPSSGGSSSTLEGAHLLTLSDNILNIPNKMGLITRMFKLPLVVRLLY